MKKRVTSEPGKLYILVIYDIISDKRRQKFSKYLNGYGWRVQDSCFEAVLEERLYYRLTKEVGQYIDQGEDSVRIYKIKGVSNIIAYGVQQNEILEEVVII